MRQTNVKWMKSNLYNAEMLEALLHQVQEATEQTGMLYRGWVSDIALEDGIIAMTGMVSEADGGAGLEFTYTAAELLTEHRRMVLYSNGTAVQLPPAPGATIMATTRREMHNRGDVGVVQKEQTAYWPEVFAVVWANTGKLSYVNVDEYTPVVMGT